MAKHSVTPLRLSSVSWRVGLAASWATPEQPPVPLLRIPHRVPGFLANTPDSVAYCEKRRLVFLSRTETREVISMAAQTRRAFLGGNTPLGFFSYFDHLIRPGRAQRLYIIKGGPGTGKSSFMKSVAEAFLESGYDIEAFHCSSDPESLDAVRIPAIEVAWLDGTAPHTIDPAFPGIFDEIVDFGAFLDPTVLLHQKRGAADPGRGAPRVPASLPLPPSAASIHENIVAANTAMNHVGPLNERISKSWRRSSATVPSKGDGPCPSSLRQRHYPRGPGALSAVALMDPVPKRIVVTGEPGAAIHACSRPSPKPLSPKASIWKFFTAPWTHTPSTT